MGRDGGNCSEVSVGPLFVSVDKAGTLGTEL